MSDPIKLGKLLGDDAKRDAIHVAIAPCTAAERLTPGENVGVKRVDGGDYAGNGYKPHVGIVDPFLKDSVKKGQRFYVCLYQGTVTSLRHDWTHDGFAEVMDQDVVTSDDLALLSAVVTLKDQARIIGMSHVELMAATKRWIDYGDYNVGSESDHGDGFDPEVFWPAYEALMGVKVAKPHSFFSCSC